MYLIRFVLLFATLLPISSALGNGVPLVIDYQGRLTDSTGVAVADGDVVMSFTIYNDVGSPLWSSGKQTVTVFDGLFNYQLGLSDPLPDDLFAEDSVRWLGIELDDAGEFSPRVQLVSTPFAFHALRADTALTVDVDTLRVGSLAHSGVVDVVGNFFGDEDVCVRIREADLGGGRIDLYHPGSEASGSAVMLAADNHGTGGVLELGSEPHSGAGVVLRGSYYTNDEPYFNMYGSEDVFCVDLNTSDKDSTVRLPESSVSAEEMYNEPGCGNRVETSEIYLSNETFTTLASRSMVFPTDGYVVVIGSAWFSNSHASSRSSRYDFGISTTSSSLDRSNTFRWAREADSPETLEHNPITVHGYFEVSAGLNTFYFLVWVDSLGLYAAVYNAKLSVMFFPTNYEFYIAPPASE